MLFSGFLFLKFVVDENSMRFAKLRAESFLNCQQKIVGKIILKIILKYLVSQRIESKS